MTTHGVTLRAKGMHCTGCEHIIEESVRKLAGVSRVEADYPSETVAIVFDPNLTGIEAICAAIARKGYRCSRADETETSLHWGLRAVLAILGIAGILLIIFLDTRIISTNGMPDVSQHMGYGLILVLGLLTGFHCVGMCGGFVLSYTAADAAAGKRSYRSHALYGAGKTLSYTTIGALFGLVGAIVTFTPHLRGIAGVLAGAFLILFGLNMLSLLAPLRRIRLKLPASLELFVGKQQKQSYGRPFVIGLLNGLNIACGPLQAMYVMAAGTGSALEGAGMLFTFGIGTLPVLLTFGLLTTLISASVTHQLLKASGIVLVILGAVMINRGLILTGTGHDLQSVIGSWVRAKPELAAIRNIRTGLQTIDMDVNAAGFSPNHFTLQKDIPVRWVIDGKEITPCNRRIVVPNLGLEFDVKEGQQVVEFTPREAGIVPWSCWMGMLHGRFDVIEGIPPAPTIIAQHEPATPAAEMPQVADQGTPPAAALEARASTKVAPERDRGAAAAPELREPEVPQPVVAAPAAPEPPNAARPETYSIVAGDTLSGIATKLYGNPRDWRLILKANPGLDPRRLRPGRLIHLPRPAQEPS
jgi:sulfite exporter TauE/SafE/copper chaperone CopZ